MLFLLLVLFCASSNAQPPPPPPPSMADTFQGSGEVEFHGTERTDFGECKFKLRSEHKDVQTLQPAI